MSVMTKFFLMLAVRKQTVSKIKYRLAMTDSASSLLMDRWTDGGLTVLVRQMKNKREIMKNGATSDLTFGNLDPIMFKLGIKVLAAWSNLISSG